MAKIDHAKLNRSKMKVEGECFEPTEQQAKLIKTDKGGYKITFRGDQPVDVAIKAMAKTLKDSGIYLLSNPALYFFPVQR